MLDEFLHTLEHGPRYWAYLLVAAAAGIEYVFPPIPGDTVALFAVALAVRAQLHWLFVYLSMTAGALAGGLVAWAFGVWLARHEESWPAFLKTPTATRALDAVRRGYSQHGPMYLTVNRFLPALRAFFEKATDEAKDAGVLDFRQEDRVLLALCLRPQRQDDLVLLVLDLACVDVDA